MNQDMNTLEHYRKRAEAAEAELQKLREQEPEACIGGTQIDYLNDGNEAICMPPEYFLDGYMNLYAAPVPSPDVQSLIDALSKAAESVKVPPLAESKAAYFKAGARAMIEVFNDVLAKFRGQS